eukprot:s805_g23.t1
MIGNASGYFYGWARHIGTCHPASWATCRGKKTKTPSTMTKPFPQDIFAASRHRKNLPTPPKERWVELGKRSYLQCYNHSSNSGDDDDEDDEETIKQAPLEAILRSGMRNIWRTWRYWRSSFCEMLSFLDSVHPDHLIWQAAQDFGYFKHIFRSTRNTFRGVKSQTFTTFIFRGQRYIEYRRNIGLRDPLRTDDLRPSDRPRCGTSSC